MKWDSSPLNKDEAVLQLEQLWCGDLSRVVDVTDPAILKSALAEFAVADQPRVLGVLWRYLKWVNQE